MYTCIVTDRAASRKSSDDAKTRSPFAEHIRRNPDFRAKVVRGFSRYHKRVNRGIPFDIDTDHWHKLLGSALKLKTIADAQIYTQHDSEQLCGLLARRTECAPALMFPFFDRNGKRIGYEIARPSTPRTDDKGKGKKYENPCGPNRAYFPPAALDAIKAPGTRLMLTEGILKALAATQAGIACIGTGVWNWQVAKVKPRQLIPDLAAIDWQGRPVAVLFDFDPKRNPSVNQGAAELARVLTEAGADVRILQLPPGQRSKATGLPTKQGIDDFIVSNGETEFRNWVDQQFATAATRSLEDWRKDVCDARIASLDTPGIYFDGSPPGSGKSHADIEAIRRNGDGGSVSLQSTHKQCQQVVEKSVKNGIDAVAFPPLNDQTCDRFDEANDVRNQGLNFQSALCHSPCPFAESCEYQARYNAASQAKNVVATHKRAEVQMPELMKGRNYVAIHEDPIDMLCPTLSISGGLELIELVAKKANICSPTKNGRGYFARMTAVARELNGWLQGIVETERVDPMPKPAQPKLRPKTVDLELYRAIGYLGLKASSKPLGDAMRLVRAVTDGTLDELWVKAEYRRTSEGTQLVRTLVGTSRTVLPSNLTVWLNDGSGNRREIEAVSGRSVEERTPSGRLQRLQSVIQVPLDVTKRTSPGKAAAILRGLLHDLPFRRVGVITHMALCEQLRELLGPTYAARVSMLEYFHGGQSRGSNDWLDKCDAVIVLGTPRVPPSAISNHLIQLRNETAARLSEAQAEWTKDYWSGVTETGKRVTVKTLAYRNHDWNAAYCSLVQSELIQAMGRGRANLPNGIPTYVVSPEPLDVPLADGPFCPLSEVQAKVLDRMHSTRGTRIVCTGPQIAKPLGLSEQRVRQVLKELLEAGRVRKVGKKWLACR